MQLNQLPLFERLKPYQTILLCGAGGGFDVFAGLPLYFALRAAGKKVVLGNLTFSDLSNMQGNWLAPHVLEVWCDTDGPVDYFPEKYLSAWFKSRDEDVPVYTFARTGVRGMKSAYQAVIDAHDVEALVLIDGGTDSLMCGTEPELGTPAEDMLTLAAVDDLELDEKLLVCLGFGIDTFHGVCHHYFLEAVAQLTKTNHFLGAFTCLSQMTEVELYKQALSYVHEHTPGRPSIVNLSISSAIDGDFGDVHSTSRTAGSELYINPLMSLYFSFDLSGVTQRVQYLEDLKSTISFRDVLMVIGMYRQSLKRIEPWRSMPM